ncbi:MAG: two-component regulator propeller domain-containing protein [Acidobacteriota bacterium]
MYNDVKLREAAAAAGAVRFVVKDDLLALLFAPMRVSGLAILETILIVWIAFFSATGVSAHSAKREVSSPFLLTHWTTENGLPQNSVTAIVQTPDGYLWLGTFGGLARFDGVKFTIFNTSNTPALPSNRITALHVGRDGTLWIGAETGELTRLHQGIFTLFAFIQPDEAGLKTIRAIYEDRAGALWLGTTGGLSRFRDNRFTNYTTSANAGAGLSNNTVRAIHEDQDGALRLGTYGGGLNRLRNGRITPITAQQGLYDDFISSLLPDTDGGRDDFWLLAIGASFASAGGPRMTSPTGAANWCAVWFTTKPTECSRAKDRAATSPPVGARAMGGSTFQRFAAWR